MSNGASRARAGLTHNDVPIAILGETTLATGPAIVSYEGSLIRATLDTAPLTAGVWKVTIRLTEIVGEGEAREMPRGQHRFHRDPAAPVRRR